MSFELEKDKFLLDWDYKNYLKHGDFKSLLSIARKFHINLDFGRLEDYDFDIDISSGFRIKVYDNVTGIFQSVSCYENDSKKGYCIDVLEYNKDYRLERKYISKVDFPYNESLSLFDGEYKLSFDKMYSSDYQLFKFSGSSLITEEDLFEYSLIKKENNGYRLRKYDGRLGDDSALILAFDGLDILEIRDKFIANKDIYFSVLKSELEEKEVSDVKKKKLVNN